MRPHNPPAMGVDHYENFPVASWLCPPALRPAVAAIYHYARTADDIADEGDAPPAERLADLDAYLAELRAVTAGAAPQPRWARVFAPLAVALRTHALPLPLLEDLLSAFAQDVVKTRYADRDELLDYCRRSANPIGRLLLHLYGVREAEALAQSDAICSALQLINFWQDLSVDLPRGRLYLPLDRCRAHGVDEALLFAGRDTDATRALVKSECDWAESLMRRGAPLVHRVPGRAGWELRGVVQGGLAVLRKIAALDHATLARRPRLRAADVPAIAWRALWMRA
jgi:squalene synthase HpnC